MAETILKGSLKEVSTTPNAEIFSLEVPPEEQLSVVPVSLRDM